MLTLMCIEGFGVFNEADKFGTFELEPQGILVILVTCIVGVAISYAGMECRNLLSATAFTVVGVLNKMATVLVNTAIWDKHVRTLLDLYRELVVRFTSRQAPKGFSFCSCAW